MKNEMPSTGDKWWHCQPFDHAVPVMSMPFLPSEVTNSVFIICEIILAVFLELRKRFRLQTQEQKRCDKFTILLATIAVIDYLKCLVAVNNRWTNSFLLFPWVASFIRPWELIIMITFLR